MPAVTDWDGAVAPDAKVLAGRFATLRPPHPEDAAQLHRQLHQGDPALWDYLPYGPFALREWREFWAWCVSSRDPRFFVVAETTSARLSGYLSMLRADTAHGSVEIGHVVFSAAMQRTPVATEAIHLAAEYAFTALGNRRLEWKCDAENRRSWRAAERFGFRYEGTFRQHMVVKGRNRDSAWFSITDHEWPVVSAAVRAWLAPRNFDSDGHQHRRLEEIRADVSSELRSQPAHQGISEGAAAGAHPGNPA